MPLVAMRASVRDVLPWSCCNQHMSRPRAQSWTYHVSEDADVPDAVGRLLQRHQLVAWNDGHAGRVWLRLGAKTAEAVVVFRVWMLTQSSAGRAVSLQMAGVQAKRANWRSRGDAADVEVSDLLCGFGWSRKIWMKQRGYQRQSPPPNRSSLWLIFWCRFTSCTTTSAATDMATTPNGRRRVAASSVAEKAGSKLMVGCLATHPNQCRLYSNFGCKSHFLRCRSRFYSSKSSVLSHTTLVYMYTVV